jgi:hypothetical protein
VTEGVVVGGVEEYQTCLMWFIPRGLDSHDGRNRVWLTNYVAPPLAREKPRAALGIPHGSWLVQRPPVARVLEAGPTANL